MAEQRSILVRVSGRVQDIGGQTECGTDIKGNCGGETLVAFTGVEQDEFSETGFVDRARYGEDGCMGGFEIQAEQRVLGGGWQKPKGRQRQQAYTAANRFHGCPQEGASSDLLDTDRNARGSHFESMQWQDDKGVFASLCSAEEVPRFAAPGRARRLVC